MCLILKLAFLPFCQWGPSSGMTHLLPIFAVGIVNSKMGIKCLPGIPWGGSENLCGLIGTGPALRTNNTNSNERDIRNDCGIKCWESWHLVMQKCQLGKQGRVVAIAWMNCAKGHREGDIWAEFLEGGRCQLKGAEGVERWWMEGSVRQGLSAAVA